MTDDEHGAEHSEVTNEGTGQDAGSSWSDDQPPVDDFADAGASEDSATVSQEAAHEGDEIAASTGGQSRSKMALLAGVGGIMLLLSVVYWQFSHPAQPPPMTLPPSAPKSSSSAASIPAPKPLEPAHTGPIEENDINALYKSSTESIPPGATATAPTSALTPVETTPPTIPPSASAPIVPVPAAQPEPPVPSAPVNPPVVTAMPPPVIPVPPPPDTRIDALTTRIEELQKSLEQANRQLSQLSNVVAANQAMPPVSNQNNPALEDRLSKIEQNLMQIEHKENIKTQPSSASTITEEVPTPAKEVSHRTKAPAKKKHVAKKTRSSPPRPQPTASASGVMMPPIAPPAPWVLRAATPSEAWVAADAKSPELRHIQVGDTLTGIGQVRAIRQTQSGWEIEGTAGTVR